MANKKISEFQVDPDIKDIDGLAGYSITNMEAIADDPAIEPVLDNFRLPGYAFTLQNIISTKVDRTDPTSPEDVKSNYLLGALSNETGEDLEKKGIIFNTSEDDLDKKIAHVYSKGLVNFNIDSLIGDPENLTGSNFNILNFKDFKYETLVEEGTYKIDLKGKDSEISILSGDFGAEEDQGESSINIQTKSSESSLKLSSAKDIFISSGKGESSQQTGDITVKIGDTNPEEEQVLSTVDTEGKLTWSYNNNNTYSFALTAATDDDPVKYSITEKTVDPSVDDEVISNLKFESGDGMLIEATDTEALNSEIKFSVQIEGDTGLSFTDNEPKKIQLDPATTEFQGGVKYSGRQENTTSYADVPEEGVVETKFYGLLADANNVASVYVPWENTEYDAGIGIIKIEPEEDTDNNPIFRIAKEGEFSYESGVFSVGGNLEGGETTTKGRGTIQARGAGESGDDVGTAVSQSGLLKIQCQTQGHYFGIYGPDHMIADDQPMENNPAIILPSQMGTDKQVLSISGLDTSSVSDSVIAKTEFKNIGDLVVQSEITNDQKAFLELEDPANLEEPQKWDVGKNYNAIIDMTRNWIGLFKYDFTESNTEIICEEGDYGTLVVKASELGAAAIEWPPNSLWVDGEEPTLEEGSVNIFSFVKAPRDVFIWSYGLKLS